MIKTLSRNRGEGSSNCGGFLAVVSVEFLAAPAQDECRSWPVLVHERFKGPMATAVGGKREWSGRHPSVSYALRQ